MRGAITLFALAFLFSVPAAHSEEPKKDKTEPKILVATSGLYLGRVVEVDEKRRFVFVKPLNGGGSRKTFYLDELTLLREQRKRADWKALVPGRRVGIRFVREDDIAYAEGVFLIVNEINPREFEMPKKRKKKDDESGEKKEESVKEKLQKTKAFSPAAVKKAEAAAKSGH